MSLWPAYRDDLVFTFRKYKRLAEGAFEQISDDAFFRAPGEHSNSIAVILKHVAGNLTSRFTDFLTADGDKGSRDRDGEFAIGPEDTRANIIAAWEHGWTALFNALAALDEADALKTIRIRGEEHTVLQALNRALARTMYHIGQIVYLARLMTSGEWKWLTIAPGQSKQHTGAYLRRS